MTAGRRLLVPLLLLIVSVGAVRFLYGATTSGHGWSSDTQMTVGYQATTRAERDANPAAARRRWGPLFLIAFDGLQALDLTPPVLHVIQRVIHVLVYTVMLYLLVRLCGPPERPDTTVLSTVCKAALVFLGDS